MLKMKSHTSSEVSIIKGYLFWWRLTDYNPLLELETAAKSSSHEEARCVFYIIIYNIRGHIQVGR